MDVLETDSARPPNDSVVEDAKCSEASASEPPARDATTTASKSDPDFDLSSARSACLSALCSSLADDFDTGQYADVSLVSGDGTERVSCHRIVLAAAIPSLRWILETPIEDADDHRQIVLPDFDFERVRSAVRLIYDGFRGRGSHAVELGEELSRAFSADGGWKKEREAVAVERENMAAAAAAAAAPLLATKRRRGRPPGSGSKKSRSSLVITKKRRKGVEDDEEDESSDEAVVDEEDMMEELEELLKEEDSHRKVNKRRVAAAEEDDEDPTYDPNDDYIDRLLYPDVKVEDSDKATTATSCLKRQTGRSFTTDEVREAVKDGGRLDRCSFRHCTADATLRMIQAAHYTAIGGVADDVDNGALKVRVIATSESGDFDREKKFEEFVTLLRRCYGVCSADLFNRPYFCTAYPISDLHCQARLYARADDVNKQIGDNAALREKRVRENEAEIERLQSDGGADYAGPRWQKGFRRAQDFVIDPHLPSESVARLVVMISKPREEGQLPEDFVVIPFPEDQCKENMILKYCWKFLLHTWWKNPKRKEIIPDWLKKRFSAVLDVFSLRQALKESSKVCDVCGEMVPLKEAFHHREKHRLDVNECCGIKLPSEKAARRHMNLYHTKDKYLPCEHCHRPFSKPRLAGHVANCDKKKEETVCPVCGELCTTRGMINNHLNNLHKVIQCEICGQQVTGAKNYNSHKKKSHTGSWPCQVCGKVFKSEYHLRTHGIRSHARDDEKPHQCGTCGRGFLSPHSLREHIMVVHEKLRPFKCRYECGMTMSCIGNRNKHEKNRHGAIFGKA